VTLGAHRRRVPGRCLHLRRRAAVVLALAIVVIVPVAGTVDASGVGGPTPFSVTPAQTVGSPARSYFNLTINPGRSGTDTVIITNRGKHTERLRVSPSTGITAPNTGSAFDGYFRPCVSTGCWVTGLAATVSLAGGAHQALPFTVRVPSNTPSKQYLSGITVEPQTLPQPVTVGSNGNASAKAIIVHQVSVGIAVTVGRLSHLRARLAIPAVTGGRVGSVARLNVHIHNTGLRFTKAHGTATCSPNGTRHSFPVFSDTTLPGDRAVVTVNAPRIGLGKTMPCTVKLAYAHGPTATWSGMVTFPRDPRVTVVHTGNGTYSNLPPAGGIPTWALALIAVGGLILLIMIGLTAWLLRSRARNASSAP
jgi:hypothetical protein